MSAGPFRPAPAGVRLAVRLTPRASRTAVQGVVRDADGNRMLKASVTAVPEAGAANAALITLLAKLWKLPKSSLTIVTGHTDRNKVLEIAGDGPALLARLVPLLPPEDDHG